MVDAEGVVRLGPPPEGAPDVIAQILNGGGLLHEPIDAGEAAALTWYLEEFWQWPYEGFAERAAEVERLLPEIGQRLWNALSGTGALEREQVAIETTVAHALSLPWELLHDGDQFVAVSDRRPMSIVRRLAISSPEQTAARYKGPLRVLLLTARPEAAGFVDQRIIARALLDVLDEAIGRGDVELEFLRPATFEALARRLGGEGAPVHVLHFDGHGAFDPDEGRGLLVFEQDNGLPDFVDARLLASLLRQSTVELAVLTACQSAAAGEDDAVSSVAAQLLQAGVGAVAAMSASVLVSSAAYYARALYEAIADGQPVSRAHREAQRALFDDPTRHRHRRVFGEQGTLLELRDWWLPHCYVERDVRMVAAAAQQRTAPRSRPSSSVESVHGRALELLRIERALTRREPVLLYGFGAMGKSTLAAHAASWLVETGLYDRSAWIALEDGDSLTSLENADARTIVVVDGFEHLLPPWAAVGAAAPEQAWSAIVAAAGRGAGVIATSRPLAGVPAGAETAAIEVHGLAPEDANALAAEVLGRAGVAADGVPFEPLQDLLAALDANPLAIELILPELAHAPADDIRHQLRELIGQCVDEGRKARHRSALASLEDAFGRLAPDASTAVRGAAALQNGALESLFAEVCDLDEEGWDGLRPQLEELGLIRLDPVHPDDPERYVRLHPFLTEHLLAQGFDEDEMWALTARYAFHYGTLAMRLHVEARSDAVRARRKAQLELFNMQRAHTLLVGIDAAFAADVAGALSGFLTDFGYGEARDEMLARHANGEESREDESLTWPTFVEVTSVAEARLSSGDVEGARFALEQVLTLIEAGSEDPRLRPGSLSHAQTLGRLARCLIMAGHPNAAERLFRRSAELIEVLVADHPGEQTYRRAHAIAVGDLGVALRDLGRLDESRSVGLQALKELEELGDHHSLAAALTQVGWVALNAGDLDDARDAFQRAGEAFAAVGDANGMSAAYLQLGLVARAERDAVLAEDRFRSALRLAEEQRDPEGITRACVNLAEVALERDRPGEAGSWCRRGLAEAHLSPPVEIGLRCSLALSLVRSPEPDDEALHRAQGEIDTAMDLADRYGIRFDEVMVAAFEVRRSAED